MEEVERQATSIDPLLACCLCRRLLQEAVQLTCLHNCCRQCFSTAASSGNGQDVACGSCAAVTHAGREQPNGFIDSQVLRHKSVAEFRMCGKCKENSEHDKTAVVWCPACLHSLCEGCVALHGQYFRQHVTQSLDELSSPDGVFTQESSSVCPIHKKPVDIACRNCELAKCVTCWAECNEKKHEMHVVGKDSFDSYIGKFIACISTMERELLRKAEVLEKPKNLLLDMKAARNRHLEDLNKRKRRVMDAVETVYQEMELSTKNAYDNLEAEGDAAAAAANRIASDLSDARSYIRRLLESNDKCEILKQQKIVRERLSVLSMELDTLSDRLATTMGEVKIEDSLPEDLEEMIRAWIGQPLVCSGSASSFQHPTKHWQPPQQQPEPQQPEQQQPEQQQPEPQQPEQQQCFSFGAASSSIQLPVACDDVALTTDGRKLLLAARRHGLIELCSLSGLKLSHWLPPDYKSDHYGDRDDEVRLVASLSDGRAAVSLYSAKLVVLLKRREQGEGGSYGAAVAAAAVPSDGWTEDRILGQLPSPVRALSAHSDLLAICVNTSYEYRPRLRLMSCSSGRRLCADLLCEYEISSLAVAAQAVVTGGQVWLKDVEQTVRGRNVLVLDAYSLPYGQQLWRHEVSSCNQGEKLEEELQGVCTDSSGGCLYVALCRSDQSSGRVSVLSLAEGSELRRVVLSLSGSAAAAAPQQLLQLLPVRLSLSEDEAAATGQQQQQNSSTATSSSGRRALLMAALCSDSTTKECRTVVLHRTMCDTPQ